MELIQQLTQGLNIKEEQAEGGAGLIFKMAQEKLGDGQRDPALKRRGFL